MSEDRDPRRRDAIGSIARDIRIRSERRGGKITQHQAEERVRRALRSGDLKRANDNR